MLYRIAHRVLYFFYRIFYRFRVVGRENIPEGAAIICGNHNSKSDPVLVALALPVNDKPYFMAKIELFRVPLLKTLIKMLGAFPIDRGNNDLGAIKKTLEYLKMNKKVLIFPQGTRIAEDETAAAKQGVAMIALKTGAPMVPLYLTHGRKLFVNRVEVIIGKPVYAERKPDQSKTEAYDEIAEELMNSVYELKSQTIGKRKKAV